MKDIGILVVDDDFRVAGIHAAMVERVDGFEIVGTAHSAEEAREMAGRLQPELVLMDVYLPDGSGLDVVRTLREASDPPDVVVISAARDLTSIRQAIQLGAVHYLVKPFGFAALAERLASYRQLRSQLDELPEELSQSHIDDLLGTLRPPAERVAAPAKGHSAPTLARVLAAVRECADDISASEVAAAIGISRATAQRYLNYLDQQGVVRLELRYGTAGRPEHRYRPL